MAEDSMTLEARMLNEDGEFVQFDLSTKASSVKLSDGSTVEENLSGIAQILDSIVGVP